MRSLDTTGISAYSSKIATNPMRPIEVFLESGLNTDAAVAVAKSMSLWEAALGRDSCWIIGKRTHSALSGFSTRHRQHVLYLGQDVRPLVLSLSERFYSDEFPVIVRRSCCKSVHCINPVHYYWGTRADVVMEFGARKSSAAGKKQITPIVVEAVRQGRDAGETILRLSRQHKIPYHVARRICSENSYGSSNGNFSSKYIERLWDRVFENCRELCDNYPKAARSFNLGVKVTEKLSCPWGHKGNFGMMGECLDCMEEIKRGRCTVDVSQFGPDWYWQVKRFWEQVNIKNENECWPWTGSSRRNGTESTAYFPSPFHSGKTQSASRIAFWLSRGYVGKYRVFTLPDCEKFCCNPTHLVIREFKDMLPVKIEKIQLTYKNIFNDYREKQAILKNKSNPSE